MTTQQTGAWKENRKIALKFGYQKKMVDESRDLGTSTYDAARKMRTYSLRDAPAIIAFCQKYNLPVSDEVLQIAAETESMPDVEMHHGGLRVYKGPGKSLPEDIQQSASGSWIHVPGADVAKVIQWAKEADKTLDPAVTAYAKGQFTREAQNYRLGTSLTADPLPITGLKSTPIPEQWVPVQVAKRSKRFILADEQGLGKTIQSLMVSRITGEEAKRLIVVCPDRLTDTWVDEMEKHFEPGMFSPQIAAGQKPTEIDDSTDAVLIGWSILGFWADTLIAWKPDMIVADEGHYAKSGKVVMKTETVQDVDDQGRMVSKNVKKKVGGSKRSDAIISLLASLDEDDKAMILTGTPIPNRPNELLPLLQALQVEGYFGGSMNFKMRYCGAFQKYIGAGRGIRGSGYVWDFSGASNLTELNARLLSSGHYVRRTKQHLVLAGRLPEKIVDGVEFYDRSTTRTPLIVPGDPEVMEEYVKMAYELGGEFLEFARKFAASKGLPLSHSRVMRAIEAEGKKRKDHLFQLRRIAGMAGIPAVKKHVQELVEQNEKVLVVAHHREVVEAYTNAFEGATKIQGGMTPKQVRENKAIFNSAGFESPVMVLALEAAKTGHTLCYQPDKTCAHVVEAEQAWNPGDERQVQDRVWRLGQNRPVTVTNVIVSGTVNEDIYASRLQKEKIIDASIDNLKEEVADVDDSASAGKLAVVLARQALQET